jgi:hypothetical protein
MSKIKVIKKGEKQTVTQCMTVSVNPVKSAERKVKSNVENWISEMRQNKAVRLTQDMALLCL